MEFVHSFNKFSNPIDYELSHGSPGRLASSTDAGAGKRRIFAIGNYLSQRLLKRFHDQIMRVLLSFPTDGTFDQVRPLDRLRGKANVYSFDFQLATGQGV